MQEKSSYLSQMTKKLSKWDKNLDLLQNKVEKLSQDSKEEYQIVLDELKHKKDRVDAALKETESLVSENWIETRERIDTTYSEFIKAVGRAIENF
jgi:hypothetical protein